ncbi:hypothetical protein [Pedobacter frigiditerrae]|uniref:hypothetical protein n=1 Tax=Pedobacter frigiditerrae TaxID=2530452 RepID=UPI002931EB04|nr:hypothetical protein [Pedobacter frigiditerrae]
MLNYKRHIFVILISIIALASSAQTIKYNVRGNIAKVGLNSYAYLIIHAKPFKLMSVPIKNGIFEFNGEMALDSNLYHTASIFVDVSNKITVAEVQEKYNKKEFRFGVDGLNFMVLETIELSIDTGAKMSQAKIVAGGVLTKEHQEFRKIYNNPELTLAFIKSHPDSPIPLSLFSSFININHMVFSNQSDESKKFQLNKMYDLFSDRLKKTKKGKDIKSILESEK